MRNLPIRRTEVMDPPGRKYWPIYKGRDICRTPMQWDGSRFAGFSSVNPWLRLHPDAAERNVAAQNADPASLLNFTRTLIALRRAHPALRSGDFSVRDSRGSLLVYRRSGAGESVLVAMNFGRREQPFSIPFRQAQVLLFSPGEIHATGGELSLPPGGVCLLLELAGEQDFPSAIPEGGGSFS